MVNLWDFIAIAVAGDCSKVKGFARDLGPARQWMLVLQLPYRS